MSTRTSTKRNTKKAQKKEKNKLQDRVLSLLGLATRARKCVSGEFSAEQAIKEGQAQLVIIASDASDNTKKHFYDMCNYRNIPVYTYSTREGLGKCTGKAARASVAVTDQGFSEKIRSILQEVNI
ncbi:MAG: ribosomal L7Ae/L30e/S12e/Gadd45 family protein [Lachnospiraceae bacterium]|nr:ribosomal L7Ae/L30e/S12e/Gadd45 family protein [Lachnospiraceae bacterium]